MTAAHSNRKKTKRKKTAENPQNLNAVDRHVGERLNQRRRQLNMTTAQLGRASGLSFQQIQKYEKGINRIAASRLYRFAQLLEVPVGYFFEGLDLALNQECARIFSTTEADKDLLRYETLDLVHAYSRVMDGDQRR